MVERTLAGFTVGITADRRWEEQAELLRRRGASVIHGPAIRTLPLDPGAGLREATESLILDPPDVVIANTGIGMRSWLMAAESWGLGDALLGALEGARLLARGPKAASVLHQAGIDVVERAPTERLCDVVALAAANGLDGCRVALQRHGNDSPDALAALVAAGAEVIEIPVYRWLIPDDTRPAAKLVEAVVERRVHALTFTSAPAVRNFFDIADALGLGDAVRDRCNGAVVAACVGPVCASAAVEAGIDDPLVPERARLGPLIRLVADRLVSEGCRPVTLGGERVVVQGAAVRVGDAVVKLSGREARLLAVLTDRDGAVVSKSELLADVWGSDVGDPHVVEVTVARLRRRLGPAGRGIVTVPRRGYRLSDAS